jgi:RNA polymerase sigma-32 factor
MSPPDDKKLPPEREEQEEEEPSEAEAHPEPDIVDIGEPALERVSVEEKHLAPARDPVQRFLNEARRYPRLDEQQERALIEKVRERGDLAAARTLVVHNLRLVVAIAYQYRQAWLNVLDLFQEGSVGLMEAVRRWDPDMGTRFGSYAAYWIRAYVLRFLMTNARLIHVGNTRAGRKLFFRLEKERQRLLAAGFDPTPKLLAARLQVDEADLEEVSAHLASREVSIEPRPGEPVALSVLGERYGVSKQRMGQIANKLKDRFRTRVINELGAEIQMAWQEDD